MLSAVLANTKLISECIENTLGEILRAQRIGMSEGFCENQSQKHWDSVKQYRPHLDASGIVT